jgi:hypothetical protein
MVDSITVEAARLADRYYATLGGDEARAWQVFSGHPGGIDPFLDEVRYRTSPLHLIEETESLTQALVRDPAIARIIDADPPMGLRHALGSYGGIRADVGMSILEGALRRQFLLGDEPRPETLSRLMMLGVEELRRVTEGREANGMHVTGFAGLILERGTTVTTPWGTLIPAPVTSAPREHTWPPHPQTTVLLITDLPLWLVPGDEVPGPPDDAGLKEIRRLTKGTSLISLACALASPDDVIGVPLAMWDASFIPFSAAYGSSSEGSTGRFVARPPDLTDRAAEIAEWSRLIEAEHDTNMDLAVRKLISAAAQRHDPADSLIDSVMIWENIVGATSETVFRVTASIAKLLRESAQERRSLQRELRKLYDLRSRVVHGEAVDLSSLQPAADRSLQIAVELLRCSYRRGASWLRLSSQERALSVLLD